MVGRGLRAVGVALAVVAPAALSSACGSGHAGEHPPRPVARAEIPDDPAASHLPPPPHKDAEMFPCTSCHDNKDLPVDPTRRELKMAHEEIVLRHDEKHRWCLDCHDATNRDVLHLANGGTVSYEESYRLCGQCHGDKYRDWRAGVHGRRTGQWRWNGEKRYLLCVHCHDAHAPRFAPLKPLPPPERPTRSRP
jgi:hypothetical protein